MADRTQIICLHEGKKGRSIDPLFIRALIKKLSPAWIRPWRGSNVIRSVACGGRFELISRLPQEILAAEQAGGDITVMVWSDVDDDMADPEELKAAFWQAAARSGISAAQFARVVFAFAQDRLENWVEFLNTGATDESREGPRVRNDKEAVEAARTLAEYCTRGAPIADAPASLLWSCKNWRDLVARMR